MRDEADATSARPLAARTAALLIAVIAVVDVVTTRVASPAVDPLFRIAVVTGLLVWARRYAGLTWDELGCARDRLGAGIRWGLLAMLILGAAIILGVALPASRSFFENHDVRADSHVAHVLEPLVVIPLATVLFEEIIFRGVLLAVLLRVTSRGRAFVVASIAFGLWHIPPALSDAHGKGAAEAIGIVVGTVAFTTCAGAIFSWLRLRSGSLLAPILAHIASNSFAYTGAVIVLDG